MSCLDHAYNIPINYENKDFVTYPYIPYQLNDKNIYDQPISHQQVTIARCFDIKYGAKYVDQ